jgi:hypothetical protein
VGLQWGLLYTIETIIQTQNTENNFFPTVKTRRLMAINQYIQHSSLPYCDVKARVMFDENICQLCAPARQHSTQFSRLLVRTALNCRIFCAWKNPSLPFASRLVNHRCANLCLVPSLGPRRGFPSVCQSMTVNTLSDTRPFSFLSNYSCHSLASDQDMVSA